MPFGCVFPLLRVFFGYVCTYSSKILPRYYSKILLRYYFKILLQNTTPVQVLLQNTTPKYYSGTTTKCRWHVLSTLCLLDPFSVFSCLLDVFSLCCVCFLDMCARTPVKYYPGTTPKYYSGTSKYYSKILLRYYYKDPEARESICTFGACIKDIGRCKKQMTCAFWTNVRRCKKQMTCALVILGVCPTKPMSSATSIINSNLLGFSLEAKKMFPYNFGTASPDYNLGKLEWYPSQWWKVKLDVGSPVLNMQYWSGPKA